MTAIKDFEREKARGIKEIGSDAELRETTRIWFEAASRHRYSYHFDWCGVPIIQFPQDLVALQEVIWNSKPDCVIETGIAHGGSLLFYASILKAMDIKASVIGVDIDIREHNRLRLDEHPLRPLITLVEGSSTAADTVDKVKEAMGGAKRILVVLDSNHTYEHVIEELRIYSPLVTRGSYLVVLDTIIDEMPPEFSKGKAWAPGRGPKRAVAEFIKSNQRFSIDQDYNNKLLISVAPDGFLKCIAD